MHQNEYKHAYVWSSGSWDSLWYFHKQDVFTLKRVVSAKSVTTLFTNDNEKIIPDVWKHDRLPHKPLNQKLGMFVLILMHLSYFLLVWLDTVFNNAMFCYFLRKQFKCYVHSVSFTYVGRELNRLRLNKVIALLLADRWFNYRSYANV